MQFAISPALARRCHLQTAKRELPFARRFRDSQLNRRHSLWKPVVRDVKSGRRRPMASASSGAVRRREVRREIENFLQALNSYPDRFARNPCISFEQHLFSIASQVALSGARRRA